jgi:phosphorylcholine metabolism protein LicD
VGQRMEEEEEVAVENLREVKDVFDKNNVTFWLDSGILLGAVRDGKMIKGDTDIDLGTWYYNLTKIISTFSEFKKRGFDIVLNKKWTCITLRRFDFNINVELYHKKCGYAWRVWRVAKKGRVINMLERCVNISNLRVYAKQKETYAQKLKNLSSFLPSTLKQLVTDTAWLALHRLGCMVPEIIPKHYFETLSTIQFYGMEFYIPCDVKKYLEYRYGSDWETPKKEWVYYRDDGARAPDWDWLCFEL